MERRQFLRLGTGGAAATAVWWVRDPAAAQPAPGAFGHGIASGDPTVDGIVLWTRVTPTPDAVPGSGLGAPAEVAWEVATDDACTCTVASGTVVTSADSDHTVRVEVEGLDPFTEYTYRFQSGGESSPIGRFRTAPAVGADPERLRFGVVSCANYEGGYFSAYRHVAARDDLDWIVHLGDYIYEYAVGGYGGASAYGRVHDPATEIVSLADYRRRHALYKTDPDLAALHQRYAMIATIDDHEVADNAYDQGAANHDDASEGDYPTRRSVAMQAYFEWMPVRRPDAAGSPERIHRAIPLGGLADLVVLDERTHRTRQPDGATGSILVTSPEPTDPDRTMLGADQLAFLDGTMRASTAAWRIVANGVMFAPLVIADRPNTPIDPVVATVLAAAGLSLPIVVNGDQWDGYAAEQATVGALFGEVGNVAILTGDIHSSWAAEVPADAGAYLPGVGGETVAVEFVTPAVSSDAFTAELEEQGVPAPEVFAQGLHTLVPAAAPWFKYLDSERQGYGIFEVTADAVQYDWHHISDRADPDATSSFATAYRSASGTDALAEAQELAPVAVRPLAGCPAVVVPDLDATPGPTLPVTGGPSMLALGATAAAAAVIGRRIANADRQRSRGRES